MGEAGQARLAGCRVLVVGVGALGGTLAEQLLRAGVGSLTLLDRDVVEETNLQRQVLFAEADVGRPKALAAVERLTRIDGHAALTPLARDLDAHNAEAILRDARPHLILDGTDNAQTRYLINDLAVKHQLPWVYGGCVGTEGRVAAFRPGGCCLRCLFPTPPAPGELATCDTAGVLGPAAGVVACLQAVEALKLLLDDTSAASTLQRLDLWTSRWHGLSLVEARRPDCPCCGRGEYAFLNDPTPTDRTLCGRDAVQVRLRGTPDLAALAARLQAAGLASTTMNGGTDSGPQLVQVRPADGGSVRLSVFADGRVIVHGTSRAAEARGWVDRLIGN